MRLIIVGVILGGLAVLLVMVSPSAEEGLIEHFRDVDDADKSPLLMRYRFREGQELVFESEVDVASTVDFRGGLRALNVKMKSRTVFSVIAVDEQGEATMDVWIEKAVIDTMSGFEQRRIEITQESIRAYAGEVEVQFSPEEAEMYEQLTRRFSIIVSPRGEVISADEPVGEEGPVGQFSEFLATHFMELPEKEVAAGDVWLTEMPDRKEMPPVDAPGIRNEFLGYKQHQDERCAVLRQNFSADIPVPGAEQDSSSVKFGGGMVFSLSKGLALVMFKRQEVESLRGSEEEGRMRASSEEEYVVKLVSDSGAKK